MVWLVIRDAAWLTADRALAITRILLVFWLGLIASIPWIIPAMQVGRDFGAFWTAAGIALHSRAADAYGEPARAALAALFGPAVHPPFFYPPTALLLWLPFALVPFAAAAALWVVATAIAYAVSICAIAGRQSLIPALAFPAVLVCGLYGQNSLFSAALFGGAAAALDRYPVLAGAFIGCLSYKPQLGLLAPLVLICTRRRHAFVSAAVMAAGLAGISMLAFGMNAWRAFMAALPFANDWNESGRPGFDKFVSPYAAARLLGAPESVAWFAQGLAAAVAIVVLVLVTRKRRSGTADVAALVTATGFCVPFLGEYDLVIFAVAGAWLVAEAERTGWLPYERGTLALLYLAPMAIASAAVHGIPLAPLALVLLATLVIRRISLSPLLRT